MNKKIALFFVISLVATVGYAFTNQVASARYYSTENGIYMSYLTEADGITQTPATWPTGAWTPGMLKIEVHHVEPGAVTSGDSISIQVPIPRGGGAYVWAPIAFFITNPDSLPFLKELMSGMPAAKLPLNLKAVSESDLTVQRHGDSVYAELKTPQTILWFKTSALDSVIPITIPSFAVQFDKIGGAVHEDVVAKFIGYPGASGYTKYMDIMGFNGIGTLSCNAWLYEDQPMTDCFIAKHVVTTYEPPSP